MAWKPDYVTSAKLKNYLNIQTNDADVFVALWITTASRNVDKHCGRQFGKVETPQQRHYTPEYDRKTGRWFAEVDDLQDLTGLAIEDANGNAITDYVLLPRNAAQEGKPYERIRLATGGEIAASALWGWAAVPSSVEVGLLLQAARLNARRDSPFGISGSPSEGGEIRLLAQLDPDFKTSLKPFRRDWWAA